MSSFIWPSSRLPLLQRLSVIPVLSQTTGAGTGTGTGTTSTCSPSSLFFKNRAVTSRKFSASTCYQTRITLPKGPLVILPTGGGEKTETMREKKSSETTGTPIVIIGAGVLGLSTATELQKRYPNPIHVVAAELPTDASPTADYASMWAGAHYRAIPGSTSQLKDEANLAFTTFSTMLKIAKDSPEAGVAAMKGVEYHETVPEEVKDFKTGDVYAGENDHFRLLAPDELLSRGAKWGCEYDSYCVNVVAYCRWLMKQFQARGGRVVQQKLTSPEAAFDLAATKLNLGPVKCVVNCSGRNFDQDSKVKIIRGQTVLVKQQFDKTITRHCLDGRRAAVIPRPLGAGTIVGVTLEIGDLETGVRQASRQALLETAVEFFPEFVNKVDDFVVLKDNVGRRPWREGGLRIEAEPIGGGRTIVHGYGAGGRGYELSWGVAKRVADLVGSSLDIKASL